MKNRKSFFEYLGIAHVEKIHSQFLAWIISPDCFAIDKEQKEKFLKEVFQLKNNSNITRIYTERDDIDILIETNNEIIIIENKIKSSQHSNQLNRYKELCEKDFPNTPKFFYFLTLIGETTDDETWSRISYNRIYSCLIQLHLQLNECHSMIVTEYISYIKRLTEIVDDFIQNVKTYDMVFKDGKKKKKDKIDFRYGNDNETFIAFNQLETILQKSYLALLVEKVQTAKGIISDTRGVALVNFPLKNDIEYAEMTFGTAIQLQQDTIKFSFAVRDNYSKSDKKWIENAIPKMKLLSTNNKVDYHKCNEPKTKAYVSISKKLKQHYWHMELDDLVHFIENEIEHGKSLTTELVQLLNSKSR